MRERKGALELIMRPISDHLEKQRPACHGAYKPANEYRVDWSSRAASLCIKICRVRQVLLALDAVLNCSKKPYRIIISRPK
jgi:hypothetical protein